MAAAPAAIARNPPRRSASIEDIFKNRGPEGPRRAGKLGGGPGGPGFRMPERSNGKSWLPLIALGLVGLWLVATSTHQVQPKQQGLGHLAGRQIPG